MSIEARITELEKLGYHLCLDGGQIRYKCLTLIEPPKDKVLPLLEAIKRNRGAVMEHLKPKDAPIPYDTLKTLYLDAFNRIGWAQGLMARPEVQKAEDRLNEVWLECMEGKASLDEFKKTISEWEGIITRAMQKGAVNRREVLNYEKDR